MKRLPSCGNVLRTCSPISPYQCLKKLSTWIGFKIWFLKNFHPPKLWNGRLIIFKQSGLVKWEAVLFDVWNLVMITRSCGAIIHRPFVIFGSGFNQGMHFPAPRPQCQLWLALREISCELFSHENWIRLEVSLKRDLILIRVGQGTGSYRPMKFIDHKDRKWIRLHFLTWKFLFQQGISKLAVDRCEQCCGWIFTMDYT